MDIFYNPKHLDLQLFSEGTGDGGTGDVGTKGVSATAAVSQQGVKNTSLADVKYGVQDEGEAQTANVQKTDTDGNVTHTVDRNAEFEKLIKGEYKDLYDAKMQDTIQRRLKSTKDTVDKYNALTPTLEMLGRKYGVDATDIEALNKAIEQDDSYYEEEALKLGVSVEHLKEMRRIQRENAELRRENQERKNQEKAAKQYSKWMNEAEQLKSIYPSFSLEQELQNPRFVSLLRIPTIDVRTAYEVIHKDEIIPAAMQFTAKTVEQKLTNKIMANGRRPTENGNSSQSAALVKSDVSQLSNADIDEINRRIRRGEKISFTSKR